MLTNSDLIELTEFRRELHKRPEISGEELETARTIAGALKALSPSEILTGIGGHGVAAIFDTGIAGPTVLFRAELDALPITEISSNPWASEIDGKGHLCGHEGHMTMLLALGRLIKRKPVSKGRIVLMFQPAEEDGSGARAVVADPAFQRISPDWAFAIHIEPGRPYGYVGTRAGLINCASSGLKINLHGKTAHAANPEDGISPADAIARLIPELKALGTGGKLDDQFRLATLTHISMGEPVFGISPADACIHVTLRTANDESMAGIIADAQKLAINAAAESGLVVSFEILDHFAASINHPQAAQIAVAAMTALNVKNSEEGLPMRASEDFGVFGWSAKATMLLLGPGENYPALHNPDYDFPDDLIPVGATIFERIARDILDS